MKINLLLFCALLLVSVGCSGSQEIMVPDRDGVSTEKATYTGFGGGTVEPELDE